MQSEAPIPTSAADYYQKRITYLDRRALVLRGRDQWLSRTRGAAFLVSLGLLILGKTNFGVPFYVLGAAAFAGFVALVGYHERVRHVLKITNTRRDIHRQQLARLQRDWRHVTLTVTDVPAAHRGVSVDLDLFGDGSLWHLISHAYTSLGMATLRDWLLHPATPQEITGRQQAAKRLATMNSFREEMQLHGRMLRAGDGVNDFINWAEGPRWLKQRPWLAWSMRGLTVAMLVLPCAILQGWLAPGWVLLFFGLLAVNILVNAIWAGPVHELFNRINAGKYDMLHYTVLFQSVASLPDDCPRLARLKKQMSHEGIVFRSVLKRLQWIMKLASGRRSALFGIPYVAAQILWFWDFHVLTALEKWQARFGNDVRSWFQAVGELEALSSFATLAHDNPAWCWAEVDTIEQSVSAVAVGHPLLPPDNCVRNNVTVGPAGTLLLITGSNMSGKSTLLRSLGVNTVLALAGAPVCAGQFRLPPVELATSMRITDSLNNGVSFFMAELGRLKSIVDKAKQRDKQAGIPLFYLLDEILQGTNTAERHIAVTRVIGHLLKRYTIGAVSTHDLDLAVAEELKNHCQTVHFRETIHRGADGETMTFDYKLRPGVASTTNALQLLRIVGLDDDA